MIQLWPRAALAASSLMRRPTSLEPVKATKRVRGSLTRRSPIFAPEPVTNESTPGGRPASCKSSTSLAAMTGAVLAGFRITGLPATSAAAVMPAVIASGKFQGGMTTHVPSAM